MEKLRDEIIKLRTRTPGEPRMAESSYTGKGRDGTWLVGQLGGLRLYKIAGCKGLKWL